MLPGADGAELEGLLAPHGYRFLLVRETDLEETDRLRPSPRFRDWLFTKRDTAELRAMGIPVTQRTGAVPRAGSTDS